MARSPSRGARQPRPARRGHRAKTPTARRVAAPPVPAETRFDELVAQLVDAGSREHYEDAALYDYEYRRRRADVNFYREVAKQRLGGSGRILELGAGTGRVTIPLARDGHHVTALDQAPTMLERLGARIAALPPAARDRVDIVRGDLCTFDLGTTFPLVIAAFNVLEHLYTRGEVDACLRRVLAHLEPGGAFVFDVQLPDLAWLVRDPTKRWAKTRFTDPRSGQAMFYSTNHEYDAVSQIVLIRLYYDPVDGTPGRVVKLTQRKFFPAELEALVAHAGFRVTAHFGDFSFRPL
ncbi:MAG TPA: methyltransferase domain-containing protein, partial [Kofleriaceae bacterium]